MVLATARPQIRMCGVLSALSFLALTGPHISLSVRLTFTTAPLYDLMAPGTEFLPKYSLGDSCFNAEALGGLGTDGGRGNVKQQCPLMEMRLFLCLSHPTEIEDEEEGVFRDQLGRLIENERRSLGLWGGKLLSSGPWIT